jgi:hypothetical protein
MKVSDVRQLIVTTLQELGLGAAKPLGERLLTQHRFYVGCRFDFEGASAIWMEEAGQVRFFDASGKLLKIIRLNANSGGEIAERAA